MLGGALFQLPPLGHTTRGGGGSVSRGPGRRLMWPTPRATPEGSSFNSQFLNLTIAAQSPKYAAWAVGTLASAINGAMNPPFLEWLMGYPRNWTSTSEETVPWEMP